MKPCECSLHCNQSFTVEIYAVKDIRKWLGRYQSNQSWSCARMFNLSCPDVVLLGQEKYLSPDHFLLIAEAGLIFALSVYKSGL